MNQRASHFSLGGHGPARMSTYIDHYPPKESAKLTGVQETKATPFVSAVEGAFVTTNQVGYKKWGDSLAAQLDSNKLRELKKHHFELGSYDSRVNQTTSQLYYGRKEISGEAQKHQEESKNKMRAHYHDFKEQGFTNYQSIYASQYKPKEAQHNRPSEPAEHNGIVFGAHHQPHLTTAGISFLPKATLSQPVRPPPHSAAIILGTQGAPMETMNQHYFKEKEITSNKISEETKADLRKSHFTLGNHFSKYATETQNYSPMEALKSRAPMPNYESGTWMNKNATFTATSTYNRELIPRKVTPFERSSQNTKQSLHLGNQGNSYETEFSKNYTEKAKKGEPKKESEPIRGDNVVIGSEGNNYLTEHRSKFQAFESGLTNQIQGNKYESNISLSNNEGKIGMTVYMDEYRKDQHNKSKLFHKDS